MSRKTRRDIRRAIEAELVDDGRVMFWRLDVELAHGRLIQVTGDALDRCMTIDAELAMLRRQIKAAKRRKRERGE